MGMVVIRVVRDGDGDALWAILEPVIREGETYTLPQELSRDAALAYWLAPEHEVFMAEEDGRVVGTYFLQANQGGGGAHVANCGYITASAATGRGVARAMCLHSLQRAKERSFRAMQFNFVVASNERAVELWKSMGFATVGRLPEAFLHPVKGYVDVYVMHRIL